MRIAPDDLTPGLFVSILETDRPSAPGAQQVSAPGVPATPGPGKDYTGAGAVLRVVCVTLPFVLVQNLTQAMFRSPPVFPIDVRRTKLIRLPDEYVRAVTPEALPKRSKVQRPAPKAPSSPAPDIQPPPLDAGEQHEAPKPPQERPVNPNGFYWTWTLP